MEDNRILVPVADTVTARQTIDYAVDRVGVGEVHLIYAIPGDTETPEGEHQHDHGRHLLQRARAWVREDVGDRDVAVESAILGTHDYLFGPIDYANLFSKYAADHGLDEVVIDPEYWADTFGPMLASFENAMAAAGLEVTEAPVERAARHERLEGRWSISKVGSLFLVSYAFYLVLGDPMYWFDIVTGAAVAGIVAITLGKVTWSRDPVYPGSIVRTIRFGLFIPYLVWAIVKANIAIATVILRPSLPIDPRLTRVNAKVDGGLPLLALANSITLTPGTLTVRGNDQRLVVHTLLPSAREDLFEGRLERAVRFVFYGRKFATIPGPKERGDAEILAEDERI